jgi:hypothetical protein
MKSLTNYIKESQRINEGLLADIIMKLLDTGLSWLGSASKFIADNLVGATAEMWKTAKGVSEEAWKHWAERSNIRYSGPPKNERDFVRYINPFFEEKNADKRNQNIDEFFKELKNYNIDGETLEFMYLTTRMQNAFITLSDENATKKQLKDADKVLNEIASKNNILKKEIEEFRAKLNNRV